MLFFTAASILAALSQVVFAQTGDLMINTLSSPVECEPVQFSWQGGAPPYYLSLIPAGQPSAPAMKQFPVQNGNSMTWTVDMPSGSTFSTSLKDSTGKQAYSDIQKVQSGPDSSCLNQTNSETMSSTATTTSASSMMSSAASTNTATTPSASGMSRGTTTTSSNSVGIHAATSSATASSTSSTNAASARASAGAVGLAGVLGLIGAAFLG
ncbi:hypothetical protein L226DRAFT_570810 [Lentinus tigrinus ALCF2SS1-7]|uniref:Ser-Thr-rich glycosyl-phosphatidyl-inositol-anchored membrane family-domain-containing protein n=1 Tax=Lentinus tigrinus ALCF2SS1-6 TaxID=1328759 RepID=A0A5C2SB62_9APHY|nr:hypothetical protein L227DRAFT_610655 [Lentinus tigrinus ALCF2SS1-6]RPD75148.1 hypothetical protein L226DRAFT_570810 [Lentinus tigrinus ALCF2SS1-7]